MEDKRGTKRSCSPSAEESLSPNDTKTPPSVPSRCPPPPGSQSEISSYRPCLPVFELGGGGFGKAPVTDPPSSSDEEDPITAISHDFEFTQRLIGELNRAVLGPPGDDKIIVLNDSDEEEMREEKTTDTKTVAVSATVNPASTASASTDDAPTCVKNDNGDDHGPNQEVGGDNCSGDDVDEP
jgi:hypothetical protein